MTEEQREIVPLTNERGETRGYETVASRLARFRVQYPAHSLLTEIIKDDGDSIAVKAQIGFYTNTDYFCVLAEGHAQEFHDSSTINRTACLENAETSAWGRALAAFGFASPAGIATADEVEKAKHREAVLKDQDKRAPGLVVELQNAAKGGWKALAKAYNALEAKDRKSVSKYMAKLKAEAEKVDGQAETEARGTDAKGMHRNAPERDGVD